MIRVFANSCIQFHRKMWGAESVTPLLLFIVMFCETLTAAIWKLNQNMFSVSSILYVMES